MITATVQSSPQTSEIAVKIYRDILAVARREQAELLNKARRRSKSYARKARESGYQAGVTEGLQQGKEQFRAALQAIVTHYEAAADRAKADVATIAHQIVESLISSYLEEHPERLRAWILQAVESLKHSRGLTLTYNPRYHEILSKCAHEFSGIMHVVSDPSLGDADFELKTTTGGISFSWRETLRTLSEPQEHMKR